MLERLFLKLHALYSASAIGSLLDDFAGWLMLAAYAPRAACGHVRRLKQALERMRSAPLAHKVGISVSFVSQAFSLWQAQGPFRATRRAFERFLVAHGRLIKAPKPDRFAPLLNSYRQHLVEVRGLVAATVEQHVAVTRQFLGHARLAEAAVIGGTNYVELVLPKTQRTLLASRQLHITVRCT
jgi:integrase/recombinase XerD